MSLYYNSGDIVVHRGHLSFDHTGLGARTKGTAYNILHAQFKNNANGVTYGTNIIDYIGTDGTDAYNTCIRLGSASGTTWITAGEGGPYMPNKVAYNDENLYLSADADIRMYTSTANDASSYNYAVLVSGTSLTTPNGNLIAGTDGNTGGERQVRVQSGAGTMYLYSQAATNGGRGLYVPAHGSGTAYSIIAVDTNNVSNINANYIGVRNTSAATGHGISLYNGPVNGAPTYGIMFAGTATYGKHGGVTSDWATYFTMSDTTNRGWIFRRGSTNVASIDGNGQTTLNGGLEIKGHIAGDSNSTGHGLWSGGGYHNAYNNIILHGDASTGSSGIAFVSDKGATSINQPSDRAFIQWHAHGVTTYTAEGTAPTIATSGEVNELIIGVGNDSNDQVRIQSPGHTNLLHQIGDTGHVIPDTGNTTGSVGGVNGPVYVNAGVITACTTYANATVGKADRWTTDRTFTVGATGKTVNGTSNVSWSKDEILGASTSAYFYRGDKTWSNDLVNTLIVSGNRFLLRGSGSDQYIDFYVSKHSGGTYVPKGQLDFCESRLAFFVNTKYTTDATGWKEFMSIPYTTGSICLWNTSNASPKLITNLANTQDTVTPTLDVNGYSYFRNTIIIPANMRAIEFRPDHASYNSYIYYGTSGNEALNFVNRQDVTSFIFWTGNSVNGSARWYQNESDTARTDNPAVQIKQNCLYVNKLLPSGTSAAYNLYVNGTGYFTGTTYYGNNANSYHSQTECTVTNTNGKIGIYSSTNRGLYEYTDGKWIVYLQHSDDTVRFGYAAFASDVGDGSSMWIHPQSSDEINFGGTGGTTIYFGHRKIGDRAVPTNYYFGGTSASANVKAAKFIGPLNGNADTATKATQDGAGNTITSYYCNLSTDQTITGTKTFQKRIVAYGYKQSSSLPFITFDKPGSYATGIGPDGTSNRIKFGPCDLAGTAWTASSSFNSNEWYFQGKITGTSDIYVSGEVMAPKHMRIGSVILRNDGNDFYFLVGTANSSGDNWNSLRPFYFNLSNGYCYTSRVYGAVWNDYAEYRNVALQEAGYCVKETIYGQMVKTTQRLEAGCKITSDTYGTCMGETEYAKTPVAVAGRVLAYPYRNRNEYELGAAVCSAPNGMVDIMTREEIIQYPERIVGTVSEIPNYEIWNSGSKEKTTPIKVNGRIWIYVK